MLNFIEKYNNFIFDLDGTIYRGDNLIYGADKTINKLVSLNKKIIFISNKTTGSIKDYYKLLTGFGLQVKKDQIINATLVIKKYLNHYHKSSPFYAIGEKKFIDELTASGLTYSTDPKKIKVVIVTLDRTLNINKIETAAKALENNAKFYAANIDNTCPVEEGELTDAGAVISALEKRTGRTLEKHFGKPSDYMIKEIKKYFPLNEKTLLIGDRIETDIAMGNLMSIDTVLVSSGVKYHTELNSYKPTYKLESVFDLL